MIKRWWVLAALAACLLGVTAAGGQGVELSGATDVAAAGPVPGLRILDLKAIDWRLTGFSAGFGDGRYEYLVPESYGVAVRIDPQDFAAAGVTTLDLTQVDPDLVEFHGGFTDGRYGYFVPFGYPEAQPPFVTTVPLGKVVRVDLLNFAPGGVSVLDLKVVDPRLAGFFDGFTDGRYGYFVPTDNGSDHPSGTVGRVDLWNYAPSGVTALDLTTVDPDLRGFWSGFTSGPYAYFVPYMANGEGMSGKLARVDRSNFTSSGVTVLDLSTVDEALVGFIGGFAQGRYAYLVPSGYGPTGFSGKAARIDLENFEASGVTVLDLATVDPGLKGFHSGFSDGVFGYFVPSLNNPTPGGTSVAAGKMARVLLQNWTASGVQVFDLSAADPNLVGFTGGYASFGYGYALPGGGGKLARFPLFVPRYRLLLPLAGQR